MRAVIWLPQALQEFDSAIAVSRTPAEFQRIVNEALENIASGRVTHARVQRRAARRCDLKVPPYSIIYTETDDEIRVFAFAHQKRRTNDWKNRLPKGPRYD